MPFVDYFRELKRHSRTEKTRSEGEATGQFGIPWGTVAFRGSEGEQERETLRAQGTQGTQGTQRTTAPCGGFTFGRKAGMAGVMKVHLVQLDSVWEDPRASFAQVERLLAAKPPAAGALV